jgi:heterodisulfide reductase subunit A
VNERTVINPLACTGCGGCVSECPNHAIEFPLCSDSQLFAQIEAILEPYTAQVTAFLEDKIAYAAADLAGANRLSYPGGVKIIRVPSTLRVGFEHIRFALTLGAGGVFLGEGASGDSRKEQMAKAHAQVYRSKLHNLGIDPRRLEYSKVYIPAYHQLVEILNKFYAEISSLDKREDFSCRQIELRYSL